MRRRLSSGRLVPVRWGRAAVIGAVGALCATAVVGATPASAAPEAPAKAAAAPTIDWAPCADAPEIDCGTMAVPLDHDKPNGPKISLALERRKANDQANKIGTLFVNPGGPGGSGTIFARFAEQIYGPDVVERLDVIGFDPRGVAASTPLQCFGTDEEFEELLFPVPSVPMTRAEITTTIRNYGEYSRACGRNAGPLLAHMSTLNVVKDLDLMRQAVGDPKLTFVGYSYGTLIGATYANMFPNKVRAIIVDGNVDPNQRTNHRLANKLDRAGGFEKALSGFLAECKAAGPNCPFAEGGDPRTKFNALRERLRQGPVENVTISSFTDGVGGAMYGVTDFLPLSEALQELYVAAFGSPAAASAAGRKAVADMLSTDRKATRVDGAGDGVVPPASTDAYSYNGTDSFYGVNCLDAPIPRVPAAYPAIALGFEAVHRTFGRAEAYSEVPCASWPVVTNERYDGPWNKKTSATVLVIGNTFDPATPYVFAQRMVRQLGNARLLTLEGYGHCTQASACTDAATARYLLTQELPAPGTRCTQDFGPFDVSAAATADAKRTAAEAAA